MLLRCTNQPFTRASQGCLPLIPMVQNLAGGEPDGQSPTSGGRREPLAIASYGCGGGPLGWMAGLEQGGRTMGHENECKTPFLFRVNWWGGGLFGRLFHVYMAWYGC